MLFETSPDPLDGDCNAITLQLPLDGRSAVVSWQRGFIIKLANPVDDFVPQRTFDCRATAQDALPSQQTIQPLQLVDHPRVFGFSLFDIPFGYEIESPGTMFFIRSIKPRITILVAFKPLVAGLDCPTLRQKLLLLIRRQFPSSTAGVKLY